MNRRDILKFAAALTGSTMLAPLSMAMLKDPNVIQHGLSASRSVGATPAFFQADAFSLITQIMDVILPESNSPSASQVNTHWIMDNMFNKVFEEGYKKNYLRNFATLQQHLREQEFESATPANKLSIIKALEATPSDKRDNVHRAYLDLKQQTISYYLATQEVAEKHLNYLPIPAVYTPCITVAEVGGKAWAE